jgi:hypothetical protein
MKADKRWLPPPSPPALIGAVLALGTATASSPLHILPVDRRLASSSAVAHKAEDVALRDSGALDALSASIVHHANELDDPAEAGIRD